MAVPFFGLSTGALFPIIALRLDQLGFNGGFIGFVTSLYYVGSLIGTLTFGYIVRRIGYKPGFMIAAVVAGVTTYLLTATSEPSAWLALRFIGGYALGAYYVVVDSWVAALGTRNTRGKLFASYETIRLTATALGPPLLIAGAVTTSLLLIAIGYLCSFIPATFSPTPVIAEKETPGFRYLAGIFRCFPLALTLAFCGGAANASFYGLGAIYASDTGLSIPEIALFVSAVLIAPALIEIPIGAIADKFTRASTAIGMTAIAATSAFIVVSIAPQTPWIVAGFGMLVGSCIVPLYALGLSRIVDATGSGTAILASTAASITYNIGASIGPASAGVAMQTFGPTGLYVFLGMVAILAGTAALCDLSPRRCCPEV